MKNTAPIAPNIGGTIKGYGVFIQPSESYKSTNEIVDILFGNMIVERRIENISPFPLNLTLAKEKAAIAETYNPIIIPGK
jgi:hypothetical protein